MLHCVERGSIDKFTQKFDRSVGTCDPLSQSLVPRIIAAFRPTINN
jgi:hypothetical protein